MTTGEKIAKCRKEKGMTQVELAEALNVTRQAVSRWEGDLAFPETDTLMKMSRLFGVSCDYLLNYGEQQPSNEKSETGGNLFFDFKNFYFEYTSKTHIGKLPLVHINIGLGRVAKGFFSVGLVSVGVVSVGPVSLGVLAFGCLCLGLVSLASVSAGLIAFGGAAIGFIAFGGLAVGALAIGGCAVGGVFVRRICLRQYNCSRRRCARRNCSRRQQCGRLCYFGFEKRVRINEKRGVCRA